MSINERIKQVRQKLALTQNKFATRIAISTSYLAGMELGNKKVNDRTIRLICMEFNIDEEWLRTGIGSMFNETADANIAKINSLFRELSPQYKRCALIQLTALVELCNSDVKQ